MSRRTLPETDSSNFQSQDQNTQTGSKDSLSTFRTESRALPASDRSDGAQWPGLGPFYPHCSLKHTNREFYFTVFEPQALMTFQKVTALGKWLDMYMKVISHQCRARW